MMALATWHVSIATMCNGEVNAATAVITCAVTQTVVLLYASYSLCFSVYFDRCMHRPHPSSTAVHTSVLFTNCRLCHCNRNLTLLLILKRYWLSFFSFWYVFRHYSRLGRVSKVFLSRTYSHCQNDVFFHAGCPSCYLTDNVKVLYGYLSFMQSFMQTALKDHRQRIPKKLL